MVLNYSKFSSVPVSTEGQVMMAKLNEAFANVETVLDECAVDPRYKALAITHLETAGMFANKGVSRANPRPQTSADVIAGGTPLSEQEGAQRFGLEPGAKPR